MRYLALLWLAAAGCSSVPASFIEASGTLQDGSPFSVNFTAIPFSGTPWRLQTVMGSSGPGTYDGFWLWWDPSVMQGSSYPSTGSSQDTGLLHFFVLSPDPMVENGVIASLVDGGSVTFTAGGPDNYAGDLSGLSLVRNGTTLVTITSGHFLSATK
jgi:hypothetical protein